MNNFLQNFSQMIYADVTADQIVVSALQWVISVLGGIGVLLITISLIRTGIKMANADSPEEQQKCKKKILYSVIGLVLIISAVVLVNVLRDTIRDWLKAMGLNPDATNEGVSSK